MADDSDLRRDLLRRIEARRAAVQAFLRANRPRTRRRANLIILLTAISAIATAGPALGGQPFAENVQNLFGLQSDSYVWRILCLVALLVSVSGAVLTNISKSQDDVGRLGAAEAVNAELDGLSSLLEYGHMSVDDGVKLYQQYIAKVPFIEDVPGEGFGYGGPPPQRAGYYTPAPPAPGRYAPPPPGQAYRPPPPPPPRS
jgi:hypothetical protein